MLTVERLKEILHYDPLTGLFTWLVRNARCVKIGTVAGHIHPTKGYVLINIDGAQYRAHRLAWLYMTGEWPTNTVDHEDRVRSNNIWTNLRDATMSQQNGNITSHPMRGIRLRKNRYYVRLGGKHLGTRITLEEAQALYHDAAVKHFGEFYNAVKDNTDNRSNA